MAIVIVLVAAAAIWFFAAHRGAWRHFRSDLTASRARPPANPCGTPLPAFAHGALAASRAAPFATLEQLPALKPGVYRVPAYLLGLAAQGGQIHLRLTSLVHPSLTLDAFIPPSACGATQEDTALYEELREVVALRFGPLHLRLSPPAQRTEVIATGALVRSRAGSLEFRPLLDLHIQ